MCQTPLWDSDPDAWAAGSLAPNGTAVPVDGGWRVTGRWPWAVEVLVAAHGTSSLADANRRQRLWRDVHTASHHAITEWQVNLEVYGKALLGVEPNITHLI